MVERRDYHRLPVEVRAQMTTIEFVSNVNAEIFFTDVSKIGAQLLSPLYFKPQEKVRFKIDMIGGPFEVEALVLDCYEDPKQKIRFDQTFVIRVQFDSDLSENDWQNILALGTP